MTKNFLNKGYLHHQNTLKSHFLKARTSEQVSMQMEEMSSLDIHRHRCCPNGDWKSFFRTTAVNSAPVPRLHSSTPGIKTITWKLRPNTVAVLKTSKASAYCDLYISGQHIQMSNAQVKSTVTFTKIGLTAAENNSRQDEIRSRDYRSSPCEHFAFLEKD